MKINEIESGMMGIRTSGKITSIGPVRDVKTKFGTEARVATAKLSDETGSVTLSLWGDQIDQVKVDSSVSIEGAMAKEWNGEIQLSVGKKGSISLVEE